MRTLLQTQGADGIVPPNDKTKKMKKLIVYLVIAAAALILMGTDDTQVIRIEAGEKIGAFKPECVNNLVRVTGTLVEDRIDEAYLAEWEREVKDQLAEQHGEGEAGCSAEQQARGESVASSVGERIAGFRTRIADRKAKEGKEYLSFYHVEGGNYEVLE